MEIDCLPLETFIEILIRTDGITVGKCRRVCKKWMESIDDNDYIWEKICLNEVECSSSIAKKKSGKDCKWYHIYKNLSMWKKITLFDPAPRQFYTFSLHDKNHALAIDYGVLPLKDTRGIVLYDMSTLKHIPVAVPEKNCFKIANNDHATVMLLKSSILLQRTVEEDSYMSEAFFRADNFVLHGEELFFFNNRDVFVCDLTVKNLESKLMHHCDYDIKEIQYYKSNLYIFTDCGKIVTICKDRTVTVKSLNCPPEWIKQIKHIRAVNDRNFVCYSRNLFKIETDKYQHLYLEFPPITALIFYGDFVLIGTRAGEILLYRLSSQKFATKPLFEKLAQLPDDKYAVQLDVCERKSGPVIIVGTFFEILVFEVDFFPHEKDTKTSFPNNKLFMYKRLLRLRDRLRLGAPAIKSIV
ncbi:hypothetical protein PYW07_010823 [Mythimna separata]|uniref:F-box domain-containing protein n=1 Tax=Mythimna separata TaxID=271217 RepID=A0AAD7Y831_MYTSE|nr:hypothetical protein PYW07_010823 [Mythimna separata]